MIYALAMGRPAGPNISTPVLTEDEVNEYRANGFLCVDRPLISMTALDDIKEHLDRLFARFDELPLHFAKDLAAGENTTGHPKVPEINFASRLAPELRQSEAVSVCTAIARQLCGPNAKMVFDHAIYKPSRNDAPTPWHQDAVYGRADGGAVTMWVPLQDVGADEGCMRFVPGSHLKGLITHSLFASKANDRLLSTEVDGDIVSCPVGAGGLVMHDAFTIHGTGANAGQKLRRAWILKFGVISSVRGFTRSAAKELALRRALQRTR